MPANRWHAFFIHLGISAVIYVVLLYLIVFRWYPQPYFAADGGWQGIQLITGVDLVLGPMLTLMVYRPGKPGLRIDLTLIALFQTVALVWGTWLVYDQRTAAVVFASGRFQTLIDAQIVDAGEHAVQMVSESTTHPPYFFVRVPKDRDEYIKLIGSVMASRISLALRGDRYEFINNENQMEILNSGIDIEARVEEIEDDRAKLDAFLSEHGGTANDYAFVPLAARYAFILLAIERKNASIVDAVNIRPPRPSKSSSPEDTDATPQDSKVAK